MQFDNETKEIEVEKRRQNKELLQEQIHLDKHRKRWDVEEEKRVYKTNYGPEETHNTLYLLEDKKLNEHEVMKNDLSD